MVQHGHRIDVVVFDMDGVLSRPHRDRRLDLLARWSGRDPAEIDRLIFSSTFEQDAECGLWPPDSYLHEVGERLGYELSAQEWVTARQATTEPDPRVLAVARALSTTCRIAMFTNNPLMLKHHFGQVFPEAAELFGDDAVFSAELGRRKPDPEAFRLLADRLGAAPGSVLFIDDDQGYVEGARAAGLQAVAFSDHRQLGRDLVTYGLGGP